MKRTEMKARILVVDDEPAGREVLYGLLTMDGYQVQVAANGKEAIEKATAVPPDLILLDVMMPGIDGFEVCRRLRKNPNLSEMPIVMLTALDDRDSLLQGIESGADDFISKPFDREVLRARVKTITRLNRFRRLVTERNKFQWAIDHADEGFLVMNNRGTIQYANRQARHYLELPLDPDEPITQRFQDLIKTRFRREPASAWDTKQLLSPPGSQSPMPRYLVRPETATAHAFWLQVNLLPINPAAAVTEWVVQLRDVTSKMILQRDMWQFQAMIAHKLRAPMVPVIGTINLLASEIENFTQTDISRLSQRALDGVYRLQNAIEEIINYVDITKDVPLSQFEHFPVKDLGALVQSVQQELDLPDVQFQPASSLAEPNRSVRLTPQAMTLVLCELLKNAQKFHPANAPFITIEARIADNRLVLKVSDDGITLSPEQLAHIWVPYYQGEKYFTGEVSGMGLGLPMVASLVWSINGTCTAYNRQPAPGMVVELALPI